MNEKIRNKRFFIKVNDQVYCSKCGECIGTYDIAPLNEYYKHADECGFKKTDLINVHTKDDTAFAYALRVREHWLYFSVYAPNAIYHAAIKEKIVGWKWKEIYRSRCSLDGTCYEEEGEHTGLYWLKKTKTMICLNEESPMDIVRQAFPKFFFIGSLEMFQYMFFHKRAVPAAVLSKSEANYIFKRIPKHEVEMSDAFSSVGSEWAEVINVYCDLLEINDQLVWYFEYQDQDFFGFDVKRHKILISENFVYSTDDAISQVLKYETCLHNISDEKIRKYDEQYPHLDLLKYFENGGENIFVPLLSKHYNLTREMLYKEACIALADWYDYFPNDLETGENLIEVYRLPLDILQKISKDLSGKENTFDILRAIHSQDPSLLYEVEIINRNVVCFLEDTMYRQNYWSMLLNISHWDRKRLVKVLKNLEKMNDKYTYIRDAAFRFSTSDLKARKRFYSIIESNKGGENA